MPSGIKYDTDKPLLADMLLDFKEPLMELCKVWEFGKNKYGKSNWKQLDNGRERYTNALVRHLMVEVDKLTDDETEIYHAAHIAFNALARLYFIMKEEGGNDEHEQKGL